MKTGRLPIGLSDLLCIPFYGKLHIRKDQQMNNLDKLRAMLRDMEDSLGIWGDIIGALSLFGILFVGLFFVGVFQ